MRIAGNDFDDRLLDESIPGEVLNVLLHKALLAIGSSNERLRFRGLTMLWLCERHPDAMFEVLADTADAWMSLPEPDEPPATYFDTKMLSACPTCKRAL
ncbi:MAG: hypothetical protein EOO40_01115 [Deltaproteobacteria bacterium]|nr:MAG: hypothetical protein EOO40_01115 [Deltaproteobacteria bacterium]